ncbi:MAG TPA: acetate--CoA ligase [Chloroflexia bacterium]|nr:acetate--CoA ligase [Chloroflexia bacterium]
MREDAEVTGQTYPSRIGVSDIPCGRDEASSAGIAWRPTPFYLERSRLCRFMESFGAESFEALLNMSAAAPERFWQEAVRDLDIQFYTPYTQVMDTSQGWEWTTWFKGAQYNYVHDALDKRATGEERDRPAIIFEGEEGSVRTLTYGELHEEVCRFANGLRSLGVEKGDRVGLFMPFTPEVAIAMLACGKIGAIFIPVFSGYAAPSVASRLNDCGAKVLVTSDGFTRRGKPVAMKEVADQAAAEAPTVENVIVHKRLGREVPWNDERDIWWDDLVSTQSVECETVRTDAEDLYMIIYTSGTTGKPKGAQHVHCGFPIKGSQDMAHGFDLQPGDILFWYTDIGWMMGPWAISGALMLGATLFMYDGTPDYPGPDRIWAMVERHGITHLGISPTAIRALMSHGDEWVQKHDLESLLFLGSTGEPWNPDPWWWYFRQVGGGRCPIINYSGGTEISGGILCCNPLLPIKPASFNAPVPGMAADVVDDQGNPVRGAVGELAIRGPWPGMTRGFWGDPERYKETYFSRIPGIWVHGDWAQIDDDGYWYILGRSDDTIKVAGKRLGPAEVESAAVSHPAVREAAAIGVPDELKGESVVVFAVLRPPHESSDALRGEIAGAIVAQLGKSLAPKKVLFVSDLPKTRNAKIMRRVIRAKYLGEPLGDITSLENPAAVEEIGRAI